MLLEYLLPLQCISDLTVTPGAGSSKFLIEAASGILRSGPVGFDYEDPLDRSYSIEIIARDLGASPNSVRPQILYAWLSSLSDH